MSQSWIRRKPQAKEEVASGVAALAVAVAVGTVTWYLTRTLLARDAISLRPEDGRHLGSGKEPKRLS